MKKIINCIIIICLLFNSAAISVFAGSSTPPSYQDRVNKYEESQKDSEREEIDATNDRTERPVVDNSKYEKPTTDNRPERPIVTPSEDMPVVDISGEDNNGEKPERPVIDTTTDNNDDTEVYTVYQERPLSNQVIVETDHSVKLPNNNQIKIYFNNKLLDTKESNPVMVSGRTMVPVRFVLEKMGYDVDFDNSTQTVIATDSVGNTLRMGINEEFVKINSLYYYVDVPAQIIGERTMVPVRFVSEKLGSEVIWDDKTNSVYITYNNETISKLYNSTIYVAERDYKLYAIPAYSYATGYYAEATTAVRSVNGFNIHCKNSTFI